MKQFGKFISIEGIEGSGKSTIIPQLANWFNLQGETTLMTREPGGSSLGKDLRSILLNPENANLDKQAELHLFLADRAQHMAEEILPALATGKTVICDRFADSTIAYQGYARGMDVGKLQSLAFTHERKPDLTLLLDLPIDIALKRADSRNRKTGLAKSEGRFDAESINFHMRVKEGFLRQAALFPERIKIIDASGSIDQTLNSCLAIIRKKFHNPDL